MSRWAKVPLGEVLRPAGEAHRVDPQARYPNFGIYSFARGVFKKPLIDGARTSASTLYRVRSGQFVYSRLFAFEGAYAFVDADLDGAFVSNEFPAFDVVQHRLERRYLRWFLSLPAVWREIATASKGMGDRRQRVHPEQLLAYEIPLPPLAEQRRIVARLDRAAAHLEERRRAAEATEREAQALLRAAFRQAIENAPRHPMRDVAPLVRRPVAIDAEAEYPELGVRSFGRGTFHKPALPGIEVGGKKLFEIRSDDLVFNIVFAWEGAVAVATDKDDGRYGSHRFLTCLPDKAAATSTFLCFFFSTPEGLEELQRASPGGAGRNRTLGLKKLEAIKVPVPPLPRQLWFDAIQSRVREASQLRAQASADLETLMPALLHEIFGETGATKNVGFSNKRSALSEAARHRIAASA